MTDIKSMNKEELKDLMVQVGEKPFRAKQIYSWLHEHLVTSYDEMGNIPGKLKEKLKDYPIAALEMVDEQVSAIDGTRKYLFRLSDGNVIESVLMRYKHGNSVCISSQVGCKMGCRFCASTIGGWTRNLLPSEMLDQIYRIQSITGERVSNVVVMGTGEPMDNYDHIVRFVHLLSDENGLNISQRNITVSTCGIVPKIYELAKEKLQITLASGLKKTVKVRVQTAAVKTSKITVSKNVTVQKGKRVTLKPVVTPFTSRQKVTYTSSNKKIATVSSKGVVTGKKKGTVKITVKSGSKSVKVTVKVK